MRIAVNASILGEEPTGVNIYTEQVLHRLLRLPQMAEHQIEVFTTRELDLPSHIHQNLLSSKLGRSTKGVGSALRRFLWNQTQFTLIGKNFDRVYCPSYNTSLALSNQIITIHDLLALRFPSQHPLQHAYCRYILPGMLRQAKSIIAISESTRQELMAWHQIPYSSIHVVPNGYDQTRFYPGIESNDSLILAKYALTNYVLMVGATFPHKNLEVVLNAFGKILPRLASHSLVQGRAPLQLAIAGGDNPYLREIRRTVTGLGLSERVKFLGYVPDSDLPALYRGAQCLTYPSLFEGFGLPILDSMASGCPVICSNTSSMPEVSGNAAVLCAPDDVDDWAESIFELSTRTQIRTDYANRGLERAIEFSWERTAKEIAPIILKP